MQRQVYLNKDDLHDWIDDRTTHLDLVASWETLCSTYDSLQFLDPLTDLSRLEEFKWIIAETNKFLTRMRTALMTHTSIQTIQDYLVKNINTTSAPTDRKALAYQKFRQNWILQRLSELQVMKEEEEEQDNGWTD